MMDSDLRNMGKSACIGTYAFQGKALLLPTIAQYGYKCMHWYIRIHFRKKHYYYLLFPKSRLVKQSLDLHKNHSYTIITISLYIAIYTWLLWTKISFPARMKSAASKQGSNSVVIYLPLYCSCNN